MGTCSCTQSKQESELEFSKSKEISNYYQIEEKNLSVNKIIIISFNKKLNYNHELYFTETIALKKIS